MRHKIKLCSLIPLGFGATNAVAVQIGHKGVGEVLIYPYYTVNNDLNTLYSIVNTTNQAKALRIRFLEGENGQDVLDFNVYLSAFDVWTGALVPATSTISGHEAELSALHATADTSCAPYLNKSGQQFLPFIIDLDHNNNNLLRARDGHFEVIEMGVLEGEAAAAVDHLETGVPSDCSLIQNAWDSAVNGEWMLDDLLDPTGGLFGSASLVNVSEGIAFSYDAIALEGFWARAGEHTAPGSLIPDLNSAKPKSKVLMNNGFLAKAVWAYGFEAVSAVLTNTEIHNEYAFDAFINGKSEWVMTFPTKSYHVNPETISAVPFSTNWNGSNSCDVLSIVNWDREEQNDPPFSCGGFSCPPPPTPELCYSSNVIEFLRVGESISVDSKILGADNKLSLAPVTEIHATENGWSKVTFQAQENIMTPLSGVKLQGLPVTGFVVQQFTNAGAADGLLAQYGSLFVQKGAVVSL